MKFENAPSPGAPCAELIERIVGRDARDDREERAAVVSEHTLSIYANGVFLTRRKLTPEHVDLFVAGLLLSEGYVEGANAIDRISFRRGVKGASEAHVTGTFISGGASLRPVGDGARAVRRSDVFALADALKEDTPLHQRTYATHSAFLMAEGRILFRAEDIGRHNALDKVIGYALRKGLALSDCILCTSGRAPTDMVRKAIRARAPVFVSKAAPTAEGLRLAHEMRLTLIGKARPDRFVLYNGEVI